MLYLSDSVSGEKRKDRGGGGGKCDAAVAGLWYRAYGSCKQRCMAASFTDIYVHGPCLQYRRDPVRVIGDCSLHELF